MRAAARLGWRIAAVVAFGVTAALAVTLTRAVPLHASLTSARNPGQATSHDAGRAPRCGTSGLRISVGAGTSAAGHPGRGVSPGGIPARIVTSYPLDFTNVSGAACTLRGYPGVAAYQGDGVQVGRAAAADPGPAASRVVLAPGATARAAVTASVPVARSTGCRPVMATGLRVVPPGATVPRYIRHRLVACAAAGTRAPVFLSVRTVQPVTSDPAASST
jgi:Domain of unknown function (DUF4232)